MSQAKRLVEDEDLLLGSWRVRVDEISYFTEKKKTNMILPRKLTYHLKHDAWKTSLLTKEKSKGWQNALKTLELLPSPNLVSFNSSLSACTWDLKDSMSLEWVG